MGSPTNFPFRVFVPAPDTSNHHARGDGKPLTLISQRPLNCWSSMEAEQQPSAQAATNTTLTAPTLPNFTGQFRATTGRKRQGARHKNGKHVGTYEKLSLDRKEALP